MPCRTSTGALAWPSPHSKSVFPTREVWCEVRNFARNFHHSPRRFIMCCFDDASPIGRTWKRASTDSRPIKGAHCTVERAVDSIAKGLAASPSRNVALDCRSPILDSKKIVYRFRGGNSGIAITLPGPVPVSSGLFDGCGVQMWGAEQCLSIARPRQPN